MTQFQPIRRNKEVRTRFQPESGSDFSCEVEHTGFKPFSFLLAVVLILFDFLLDSGDGCRVFIQQGLGISSFLRHIECGTRVASLETLLKLCTALDTNPNYLLAASTGSLAHHTPDAMSEETRKQLEELFYQEYQLLQTK